MIELTVIKPDGTPLPRAEWDEWFKPSDDLAQFNAKLDADQRHLKWTLIIFLVVFGALQLSVGLANYGHDMGWRGFQ